MLPPSSTPVSSVRVLQTIVGAMVAGVAVFTIIAIAVGPLGEADEGAPMLLAAIGAIGLAEIVAYFVMRSVTIGRLKSPMDAPDAEPMPLERVLPTYASLTIIRGAMIEGLAVFAGVLVLLYGHPIAIIIAGAGLALLVMGFPTQGKFKDFASKHTGHLYT